MTIDGYNRKADGTDIFIADSSTTSHVMNEENCTNTKNVITHVMVINRENIIGKIRDIGKFTTLST